MYVLYLLTITNFMIDNLENKTILTQNKFSAIFVNIHKNYNVVLLLNIKYQITSYLYSYKL